MNRGMIVGKVYRPSGKPAGDAIVFLARVYGASGGLLSIQRVYGKINSDGAYALPFLWSGASFADDLTIITADVGAWTETITKSGYTTSNVTNAQAKTAIRCAVIRDAIGQLSTITNTFNSIPEIAESALFLGQALANWSGLVPFWKTNLLSTEGWLILGSANIYLK